MITIIVAARNDDYGDNFYQRFFRSAEHNAALFISAGIPFEYLLAEWNPLPDRPLLSEEFVHRIPKARAIVIPPEIHAAYSLNTAMPFHEMAAKNATLRRAHGETVIITNADILFSNELVLFIAEHKPMPQTLYRAHRIDVDPALSWIDVQHSSNQLPSGEGLHPPPYYLGAGGDFCLATKALWHKLRGFNERIRFSTRAKDWQFFLSAAAQGVEIEFIGNVYHLDHSGGFRNTPTSQLSSDSVHFGGCWDIEFGLPVMNPEDWGFGGLPSLKIVKDSRIEVLDAQSYVIPPVLDQLDRNLRKWLTWPACKADTSSALLFHALYAAYKKNRRFIFRSHDIRQCLLFSGLQQVAHYFCVPVFCDYDLPPMPGFSLPIFQKEPPQPSPHDYILEEKDGTLRLFEAGSHLDIDVLPKNNCVGKPEYNPLLLKRLLLACLKMRKDAIRRIAIFGAGRHTEELLNWGLPDDFEIVALLKSSDGIEEKWGKQVLETSAIPSLGLDAILLSSSSFEPEMKLLAEQNGAARVISLYSDWPRDFRHFMDTPLNMGVCQ